jgi:hypothetical protein
VITEDQVQTIAAEVLPNVLAGLRREIQESALYQAKEIAKREVAAAVEAFVKAEVVPDIHAALIESKDGLVSIAPALAESMCKGLADSLHAALVKKLETSWDRKKLFEALLS